MNKDLGPEECGCDEETIESKRLAFERRDVGNVNVPDESSFEGKAKEIERRLYEQESDKDNMNYEEWVAKWGSFSPIHELTAAAGHQARELVLTELRALAGANDWKVLLEDRLAYYEKMIGDQK